MAYSGLGFAAAMDALPSAFNFGKSLVGQDDASLDRALKEKALAASNMMQDRELRDRAVYQRGVLDAQNYQNETLRRHYGVADQVAQGELGLKVNEQPSIIQLRKAQSNNLDADNRRLDQMVPFQQTESTARANQYNATAGGVNLETQRLKEVDDLRKDVDTFIENPFLLPAPRRQRIATELGVLTHPDAERAVNVFDAAAKHYQQTGDKGLFNDELRRTLGGPMQALIDQNTNADPGTYQFDGLEPVPGGGVKVKLRVNPELSGKNAPGREDYQQLYITDGRAPMAEGGKASIFSQRDMYQLLGSMRAGADWQKADPELVSRAQDARASLTGAKNYSDYVKHNWDLYETRMKGAGDTAAATQKSQEYEDKLRSALEADVIKAIDDMSGYDKEAYPNGEEDRSGQAAIQDIKQKRQRAIAAVRAGLKNTSPEMLRQMTADGILGTPALAPLLNEFRQSVIQPAGGVAAAARQTGPINNPR